MGLSHDLADASSDSLLISIVISTAKGISYIHSLFFCLLHSVLKQQQQQSSSLSEPVSSSSPSPASIGSELAGLVLLADHLSAAAAGPAGSDEGCCVFCLEGMREGERIRRLGCCHVFHRECVDGWLFDQMRTTCPVCRAPMATEERRAEVERRIGAELVAWLSPY